jgi:hypothetical protein
MAMLTIDREALRERLQRLFQGNISAVAAAWPHNQTQPHRSTILRWFSGDTLPRTEENLLSLAAALDLDPFALWHLAPATFPAFCARIFEAASSGNWNRIMSGLAFVGQFVLPSKNWPPIRLVRDYYGKEWVLAEFSFPAMNHRDYFESLLIVPRAPTAGDQVWHFAWRPALDAPWRPYGFVRLFGTDLRLFSFTGLSAQAILSEPSSFCVETWIGPGSAHFRVASIHDFSLQTDRSTAHGVVAIRFA